MGLGMVFVSQASMIIHLKYGSFCSAEYPLPCNPAAANKLRQLLTSCFAHTSSSFTTHLSILVSGARGSGKGSLIRSIADYVGYNNVNVECYDIIGDTAAFTEGSIQAQVGKASSCSPSILVLNHIEALCRKTESSAIGRVPPIVKVIEDALISLSSAAVQTGWPCVMIGTTADEDAVATEVLGCFKQKRTS